MTTFSSKFGPVMAAALVAAALSSVAQAQRPIGTVLTTDASVGGVLETSGGTATIVNNGTVTAHEQTAIVTLARGGKVNVCATSVVHLSQSAASSSTAAGPMLVALDRGALELSFLAGISDALLTPDMRMQPASPGPLDLRIRVVSNGDTCVENRGVDAPALMFSDTFGESSYVLHAQQHVLFEHGSLKQVVDNESSTCGCPPPVVISVAESGVSGTQVAKPGSTVASTADAHPFPEAASEGLTTTQPPQKPALGHVSADLALTYNSTPAAQPAMGAPAATAVEPTAAAPVNNPAPVQSAAPAAAPVKAEAPPPPPPPTDDLGHLIVRFYRWVFHRRK